jgi:heme-degrading monooxygenase HmoA
VIEVPEGAGPEVERRLAERASDAEDAKGFLGYELLRPVEGRTTSPTAAGREEDFQAFVADAADDVRPGGRLVDAATSATLPEFEITQQSA